LEGYLALIASVAIATIFGPPTNFAQTVGVGIAYAASFYFFDLFVTTDFTFSRPG